MKKKRQPLAQIGAFTLWQIAISALDDVEHGDDNDQYVKRIRKCAIRAREIAERRMAAKGLNYKIFLKELGYD